MDDSTLCLFVLWTIVVLLILTGSPGVGQLNMSPAFAEAQLGQDSKQLLALANGFNALLEAAKQLTRQEQLLRSRLQSAHDEYLKFASELTEAATTQQSEAREHFLKRETDGSSEYVAIDTAGWFRDVEQAGYLSQVGAKAVMEASEVAKAVAEKQCHKGASETNKSNMCPFAKPTARSVMEKDFTTNGTKGNLRCPFSTENEQDSTSGHVTVHGKSEKCGNDDLDPIKAEFHSDAPPCVAGSTRSAAGRCPIRYLDDHAPEEIAEFFQKHKHEIPRSHSICIQRYQKDPSNLRQIDEKYGDLVSMVKGLGVYHQPYLPSSPPPDAERKHETDAAERVEKWAEDVSNKSPNAEEPQPSDIVDDDADIRENHFDRSLRDVRVGESPSRPWGIHVPVSQQPPQSGIASPPAAAPVNNWSGLKESASNPSSVFSLGSLGNGGGASPPAKGRCPFGHSAKPKAATPRPAQSDRPLNEAPSELAPTPDAPLPHSRPHSPQPRIVFNGPVILGYSAESVAMFLEKLGQVGKL